MSDLDKLIKTYKGKEDSELEDRREEIEATMTALRKEFQEIGRVLDIRRQQAVLPSADELDAQIAALQEKRKLAGIK